ncbi:MAG: FprA family A-type flavoprotein [Chloroflexi bacterium]|nr:FprA family A-type flavoprotein [Chloroflexota bacterium]MBL7061295.1 FprA family A-type flavoprotein [Dehalococcoidia bacterium]
MVKAIVVYESKYGNTKLVAETIVEGMNQVPGTKAMLVELNDADLNKMGDFDAILVGSPNHMGRATRSIAKFIDRLGKLNLEKKRGAVFDTYLGGDFEKAAKKMEKQLREKAPGLTLVVPGLSIRVGGMKGPVADGELPKCKEFGVKIATLMKEKEA